MATHHRRAVCALLLAISACTDLKPPKGLAGTAGAAGAGTGGAVAGLGGANAGTSASAGKGGASGTQSPAGTSGGGSGAAGSAGAAGSMPEDGGMDGDVIEPIPDAGADASDGEVTPNPSGPIHGKVIDYFENPVPDIEVKLNGATTMTDEDGEFTFGETPETYSISLSITVARLGAFEEAGYLFVDLTRRDPTLQVYRGLPMRSGIVTRNVTGTGVTFPLPSTEKIPMDFAGDYGGFYYDLNSAMVTGWGDWEGPPEVQGHVHAIRLVNSATSPTLPTSYLAHDSEALALNTNAVTSFTVDMTSAAPLSTGVVSGNVTSGGAGTRYNHVFVRFTDDAAVQLLSHVTSAIAYSYLVPSIPNSAITVAATRSDPSFPPYAVAYEEGVAPGEDNVDLEIPLPATLGAPAANASNVDASTVFSWSGPDQVYMFAAKRVNFSESYYVITARKQATLPLAHVSVPGYVANTAYTWSVRTHRTFATVDAATGPEGYLDSYCYGRLRGPRRGSGTHTETATRSFTSAP